MQRSLIRKLLILVGVGAIYFLIAHGPLPFTQTWWKYGETHWHDPWYRRHRVADGLVLTRTLLGKSRAEVVAKLGEPPITGYFREWSMVYNLGSERGWIAIDSEWLVLRLDAKGVVTEAKIVSD